MEADMPRGRKKPSHRGERGGSADLSYRIDRHRFGVCVEAKARLCQRSSREKRRMTGFARPPIRHFVHLSLEGETIARSFAAAQS